jgi:hypothetical protein
MKTSINLKTSKMKNKYLKLGMMAAVMLSASIGFAQTAPADAGTNAGIQKDAGAGESIKVIDNKGTIKYLQTNNGITSITSTLGGNRTTTTWQLGGTLTDATYIDATGAIFALDGIALETGAASTNATTGEIAKGGALGIGYTFLVRDEATGATKKLLASDLITGIRLEDTQAADAIGDVDIVVQGLPNILAGESLTTAAKLSVYRNGVKLRFGTDFTVVATVAVPAGPDIISVNIIYDAADLPMYAGDIIEIQYLK